MRVDSVDKRVIYWHACKKLLLFLKAKQTTVKPPQKNNLFESDILVCATMVHPMQSCKDYLVQKKEDDSADFIS